MLRIRLRRTGRKNRPHYRIVVAEHSAPLTGKFVAGLGHFDPRTKVMGINQDRLVKWLGVGAQPSNRVAKLLTTAGISHKLIVVKQRAARAPKNTVEAPAAAPAPAATGSITESPVSDTAVETVTETATTPTTETESVTTESATDLIETK